MKSKISIIIPCYNVQKYVMRCFEAIRNQTYGFENLEVVFIDDLSTDNTYSIIESLQKRYPQNVISVRMQKKGLAGGARNLGLDIASGKYITFVDADDYIHPEMLNVLYEKILEDDYDFVQCRNARFGLDKPLIAPVDKDCHSDCIDLSDLQNRKNAIISLTGLDNVVVWGKLYTSAFLKKNKLSFLNNRYFEDNHFSFFCIVLAKRYCKIDEILYFYFENETGITGGGMEISRIFDLKRDIDDIRREIIERELDQTIISLCSSEVQIFQIWKEYFETWMNLEKVINKEQKIYKNAVLEQYELNSIMNNPYIRSIQDAKLLEAIKYLEE